MSAIEIAVFSRTNLQDPLLYVTQFRNVKPLEEHNRDGGATFDVRMDDPKVIENPQAFRDGNYCRIKLPGKVVWMEIQRPTGVTIDESNNLWMTVAGNTPLGWLRHGIVYPAVGQIGEAMNRRFNFASPDGAWLKPGDWGTPTPQGLAGGAGNPWGSGYPNEWPVPSVNWVWDRVTASNPAPAGDVYLRRAFTITGSARAFRLYASVADIARIYIDGAPVMSITEFSAYQRVFTTDIELPPGQHVIGVHAVLQTAGKAGVALALTEVVDSNEQVSASDRIVWTGQSGWMIQAYPVQQPGWSPGLVMKTLFDEAVNRGVEGVTKLTLGFDGTVDSNGTLWNLNVDFAFEVGTNLREVVSAIVESACDVWIDEVDGQRRLCMAESRGVDRSTGDAAVQYLRGHNVAKAAFSPSDGDIVNRMLVNTATGIVEMAAPNDSEAQYGRREDYLSITSASKNGTAPRLVGQVWDKRSKPIRYPVLEIEPAGVNDVPWVDFQVGDWVLAPDDENPAQSVRRRVMSIAAEQDDDTGRLKYAMELDSIAQAQDERVARWLSRNDSGSLGGEIGTGNSSDGPLVQIPGPAKTAPDTGGDPAVRQTPAAPTSLGAATSTYVDSSGQPRAEVVLTWAQVTSDVNGASIEIDSYEVWARRTDSVVSSDWTSRGFVSSTAARVSDLPPLTEWQFRVRAIARRSAIPSAFSSSITVTTPLDNTPPPAPSPPIGTSRLGTVTIVWDGLTVSGGPMPADFERIDIWQSSTATGTGSVVGSLRGSAGTDLAVLTGLAYRGDFWFWFTAVDTSGNVSDPSVRAKVTVHRIEGPDLEANSVTTNALEAGAVTAVKVAAQAIEASKLALGVLQRNRIYNPSIEDTGESFPTPGDRISVPGWTRVLGNGGGAVARYRNTAPYHSGSGCLVLVNSGGAGGGDGFRSDSFPVTAGEQLKVGAWYANTNGYRTALLLQVVFLDASGAQLSFANAYNSYNATPTSAWVEATGSVTVPSGAVRANLLVQHLSSATAAAVVTSPTTVFIDDVSVLGLGTPAVELTPAGIKMWNSSGVQTVDINGETAAITAGTFESMPATSDIAYRVRMSADTYNTARYGIVPAVYFPGTGNNSSSSSQWGGLYAERYSVNLDSPLGSASTARTQVKVGSNGLAVYIGNAFTNDNTRAFILEASNVNGGQWSLGAVAYGAGRAIGWRYDVTGDQYVDITGTLRVSGNLFVSGGSKSFAIDHPTLDDKTLVHAATESPEPGVHYWNGVQGVQGADVIGADGTAVVELPDYFEDLVDAAGRAVLVSAVGKPYPIGADPVVDGRFTVYGDPGRAFSWLVHAVRSTAKFDAIQDKHPSTPEIGAID